MHGTGVDVVGHGVNVAWGARVAIRVELADGR